MFTIDKNWSYPLFHSHNTSISDISIVQEHARILTRAHQTSPKKLMCGTRRPCKTTAVRRYSPTTASEARSCIVDTFTGVTNSTGRIRVHTTTYRGNEQVKFLIFLHHAIHMICLAQTWQQVHTAYLGVTSVQIVKQSLWNPKWLFNTLNWWLACCARDLSHVANHMTCTVSKIIITLFLILSSR